MLEVSSSLGSTRNWSQPEPISHQTWNRCSERVRREQRPALFTQNRKRGDQGVDALHYTERTGTASNDLAALFYSMPIRP